MLHPNEIPLVRRGESGKLETTPEGFNLFALTFLGKITPAQDDALLEQIRRQKWELGE